MKRKHRVLVAAAAAACALAAAARGPLGVATGYTSHVLCSEVFVAGRDPGQVYKEAIEPTPGLRQAGWALRYEVDRGRREVRTTVAGVAASRAVYREGLGCLLVRDGPPAFAPPPADAAPDLGEPLLPAVAGPDVVEPADEGLRAALDRAFEETEGPPHRRTKAVVVVSGGRVVAERYAAGYGVSTPLLGWSVTKSVVNALVGIAVRKGRLSLDGPAPVAAWRSPGDPRGAVTIDHLLRNLSGLELEETNSGFDPSSQAVFLARDTAGFAERAPLASPPGTAWAYSSGNYQILSRVVRDAAGGADEVLRFARRELFGPLGMRDVTLEVDATGTPVGASFMLAPARDWARFGMLYADDGVVGGRRILPEGWVKYSSSPTLGGPYAAGFWRGSREWRARWGVPDDGFYASGSLGQRVVVIPSERLVVARFGFTQLRPDFDANGLGRLIADVRHALAKGRAGG